MAITIVGQVRPRRGGTFVSRETFAQATATVWRFLNQTCNQHALGVGTASGIGVNVYRLSTGADPNFANAIDAVEGDVHDIFVTATGEAKLTHVNATCTGSAWVFAANGDHMQIKFVAGRWHVVCRNGVTSATE